MKLITRSTFIVSLLIVTRILSGCFNYPCSEEVYYFDFTKVSTTNLDNSGMWPIESQTDTMKKAAFAFQVNVTGDFPFLGKANQGIQSFGFSSAKAFSKTDCPMLYGANSRIDEISILTLFKISGNIPANSDVSDLFLCSGKTGYYNSELYIPLNQLYPLINQVYEDYPETQFRLFLKNKVEADSARFIINVKLADNTVMADTTNLIFIK